MALRDRLFKTLDKIYDRGYHLAFFTSEQIARELKMYNEGFANDGVHDLTKYVKEWKQHMDVPEPEREMFSTY